MDAELISTIEDTVYEIWRNKSQSPVPDYLRSYLHHLNRNLNKMRSVAGLPRDRLNVIKSFYVKFERHGRFRHPLHRSGKISVRSRVRLD